MVHDELTYNPYTISLGNVPAVIKPPLGLTRQVKLSRRVESYVSLRRF